MADYALTGKKGTGKSKNAVRLIRDRYLSRGRRAATNLDLDLEAMFGPRSKASYIRVPDKPSGFDLEAAGHGNPESYDEDRNGGLFLDELGTWLNSRSFADKGRFSVLDFLAHGRKFGWDSYYIMQDVAQVDKQLRESFIEFTTRHIRFDRIRIPIVGGVMSLLFGEKVGYFPRFHSATTRLGFNPQGLLTDRAMFGGAELHKCYDTRQVFRTDYPHGTHSVLSPWHVKGRYLEPERPSLLAMLVKWAHGEYVRKPQRVTSVDPAWARVRDLCGALPPAEALRLMASYSRHCAARSVDARASAGRGRAAAA